MPPKQPRFSVADGATEFEIEHNLLRSNAAKARRFGDLAPVCVECGETDDDMLTVARKSLLQIHHPAQLHEGPEIVLCLNDHAKATAQARLLPRRVTARDRTELERIIAFLYGQGLHFTSLGRANIDAALWLYELNKRVPRETYADIPSTFARKAKK